MEIIKKFRIVFASDVDGRVSSRRGTQQILTVLEGSTRVPMVCRMHFTFSLKLEKVKQFRKICEKNLENIYIYYHKMLN